MKVLLFLFISIALVSSQTVYPPGLNFMMKTIIFDKIREIMVPALCEKFKVVKPGDIEHKSGLYEVKLYDMESDTPVMNPDQVVIQFDESDNSMYFSVKDFETQFSAKAYGRALFVHAHGDAGIHVKIDELAFKAQILLKADGDLNELDYHIDELKLDLSSGDIHMTHLSIGILPSWLLTPVANLLLDGFTAAYHVFEGLLSDIVVDVLNLVRLKIPDSIAIPNEPLSVSLSFPDVPHLKSDRIEIPFDGTIYMTSQGYHPHDDPAPAMPSYNENNPNNIQVFLNQHMLKTTFQAAKDADLKYEINKDTLAPLSLPDNVMTVKYLSLLFPFLSCTYDSDTEIRIDFSVDKTLNTEIDFDTDQIHGDFSPNLAVYAGDDLAFTIAITATFTSTIKFQMQGKQSMMTGDVTALDLNSFTFTPGTVTDTDLDEILNNFKPVVIPVVTDAANKILNPGVIIPVIPLIKDVFEIDIDDIDMVMMPNYMEASFTLDIHQREILIEKLLKDQAII